MASVDITTTTTTGYPTCPVSQLSLLLFLSAGKHKNTETIPPFMPDIHLPIRALTSLNLSKNELCGIDEYGDGEYDASGVTALADAIGKHQ